MITLLKSTTILSSGGRSFDKQWFNLLGIRGRGHRTFLKSGDKILEGIFCLFRLRHKISITYLHIMVHKHKSGLGGISSVIVQWHRQIIISLIRCRVSTYFVSWSTRATEQWSCCTWRPGAQSKCPSSSAPLQALRSTHSTGPLASQQW